MVAPAIQTDRAHPEAVLLIRTDASSTIGIGHVMRCLALAEAWIELGGRVTFAMREVPPAIADRIAREGARVAMIHSSDEAAALAHDLGARFAVVDGYRLGAVDQSALAASARLLVIDDRGETATPAAAIVLNHNVYAKPALYAHLGGATRLLLGCEFALLRREFRASASLREVPKIAQRVLVSFGGADPANVTPRVIEAVASIEGLDVVVVAGVANPRAAELRVPEGARAKIRIVAAVDDMAEYMRWADLAIVAAGVTCWELAACGVPMIMVTVADNQLEVASSLSRLGIGIATALESLTVNMLDRTVRDLVREVRVRSEMARKGREIIDGQGAFRVCDALRGAA